MSDLQTWAYRESFVCWANDPAGEDYPYDHDYHPTSECDWGWVCNAGGCLTRTDEKPCPDHAPTVFPGLRLVECQANPPHLLWAHDRDDYGHGCPWCWYERTHAELEPLKLAAEKHAHRWCWALNPLKRLAIRLRVARANSYGGFAVGCWHVSVKARWRRKKVSA